MADERTVEDQARERTLFGGDADEAVRQGGINQGQGSGTGGDLNDESPEDAELRRRRMAAGDLVDDNAGAHLGGAGAQGGMADFASQGNLAGTGGNLTGGAKLQP